jgi:ABC-2 type transport system permease protein
VSDRGVVYDLGYVPHEGPRLGRAGAVRATIKDGVRRVLGLRRRARKKILPWMLFAIALIPAVVFVGLAFFLEAFAPEADSPFGGHADYYNLAGWAMILFTALAGPELLIPDREQGVLAVYSSRPLRARDYLLSRGAALAVVIAGFLVVPQLLMYVGFAAIDSDGFVSTLVGEWQTLWAIFVASVAFLVGYGTAALLIAVYTKRLAPATGIFLGILAGSTGLAAGLAESGAFPGSRYAALGAVFQHPFVIKDWVFGEPMGQYVPTDAGFGPGASAAVIVALAVVAGWLALRRYRRLM